MFLLYQIWRKTRANFLSSVLQSFGNPCYRSSSKWEKMFTTSSSEVEAFESRFSKRLQNKYESVDFHVVKGRILCLNPRAFFLLKTMFWTWYEVCLVWTHSNRWGSLEMCGYEIHFCASGTFAVWLFVDRAISRPGKSQWSCSTVAIWHQDQQAGTNLQYGKEVLLYTPFLVTLPLIALLYRNKFHCIKSQDKHKSEKKKRGKVNFCQNQNNYKQFRKLHMKPVVEETWYKVYLKELFFLNLILFF